MAEEVKMEGKQERKKLSYEQLENVARQLSQDNQRLYRQLNDIQVGNAFKVLDFLFKVVENAKEFSPEFIVTCTSEIQRAINDMLTPKAEKKEESKEESKTEE